MVTVSIKTVTRCLIPHLEHTKELIGKLPEKVIAYLGYGSEENYEYLEGQSIEAYVKYNNFHLEQKRSFSKKIFRVENFPYDAEKDEFTCPAGKRLRYLFIRRRKTDNGYLTEQRVYECEVCSYGLCQAVEK